MKNLELFASRYNEMYGSEIIDDVETAGLVSTQETIADFCAAHGPAEQVGERLYMWRGVKAPGHKQLRELYVLDCDAERVAYIA